MTIKPINPIHTGMSLNKGRADTFGKYRGKECYTCGKPATTVHNGHDMCLQCVSDRVKYADIVRSCMARGAQDAV